MSGGPDGNKTEKPTPKRLEEARKKGNFLYADFTIHLVTLLVGSAVAYFIVRDLPFRFDRTLHAAITLGHSENFASSIHNYMKILASETLVPSALIFGMVALFSVLSSVAQTGPVFQGAKLTKGMDAINPVTNFKNLFSKRTLVNLLLSIVKVFVLCFVGYKLVVSDIGLTSRIYAHSEVMGASMEAGQALWKVCLIALISLIPLAIIDFATKHHFYIKENMMGKDEVQREHKENEGSPEVKSERKAIGRELLEGVDRLDGASAVIRNPTHIAVVVRFEPNTAPVPYISEMAEGRAAKAIINRAIEKGVPLYEDIPFARALFATGEVNTHMPLELSEKIVPFIYWLQSNHPDRVFDKPEFNNIHTRIGDVKR